MSLVLGIDTGGTYTDGVVVELAGKKIVAKAKALTTREDLTVGIRNCIDNLGSFDFSKIMAVSLSTTLATNAIVEGRGCEVGLVMIGHEPVGKIPTAHIIVVPGGHDVKGSAMADLDQVQLRSRLEQFRGKVDAIAISGFLSIRNPEHELAAQALIMEVLGLPVVCAHQLTTTLGLAERTVTAVLNARLLPIISELVESVKSVLAEKEIDAPLMLVKGDGCLMGEELAREKPIETILSGPASSIIGGNFLTQTKEALVLDMGGTTTDIAFVDQGVPRLNQEGARVGGWLTRVRAAEIFTYGLGGDSYLQLSQDGRLIVGPQRVWPLCVVTAQYPYLERELRSYSHDDHLLLFAQATDCFLSLRRPGKESLSPLDQRLLALLEDGPHTLFYLANRLEVDPIVFNFQHLVNLGLIARVSMTPTDILHATGAYLQWHQGAARLGAEILAGKLKIGVEAFLALAEKAVVDHLCLAIIQSGLGAEGQNSQIEAGEQLNYLMQKALHPERGGILGCRLKINVPIVGIGAPIHAWLPRAAEILQTEMIVPEHAEVANAVGAATGKIMESVNVLVKPGEDPNVFLIHTPWAMHVMDELAASLTFAENEAKVHAAAVAKKAGAQDYELLVNREEVYTGINLIGAEKIFVECRIRVTAVGRSQWD